MRAGHNQARPNRRQVMLGMAATAFGCGPSRVSRESSGMHVLKDKILGLRRQAHLIVPEGLDDYKRAPILLGLHGKGDGPEAMYERFGWRAACAKRGWIGIFPVYEQRSEKHDNIYLAFLIQRATAFSGADATRAYVVGHGAGGRRAYALASGQSKLFAAVGAVSAVVRYLEDDLEFQDPAGQVLSVIHLHGGKDTQIPVAGGPVKGGDHKIRSAVPLTVGLQPWIDHIGGVSAPVTLNVPQRVDGARWTGQGREVVRLIDPQQDHTWNGDFGTEVIGDFFAGAPPQMSAGM